MYRPGKGTKKDVIFDIPNLPRPKTDWEFLERVGLEELQDIKFGRMVNFSYFESYEGRGEVFEDGPSDNYHIPDRPIYRCTATIEYY